MSTPVKLRRLSPSEVRVLKRVVSRSSDKIASRRAVCVLAAASKMRVPEISRSQFVHETYVRKIIHAFNKEGLSSLGARYGKGRPVIFTALLRQSILDVVVTPPHALGLPFGVWSLPKLRDYLIASRTVQSISIEWLRQILMDAKVSLQRTKTWKQSNDPDYARKKRR
jgi:transposase